MQLDMTAAFNPSQNNVYGGQPCGCSACGRPGEVPLQVLSAGSSIHEKRWIIHSFKAHQ